MRAWLKCAALIAAALVFQGGPALAQSDVTVFAAASLKNALDAIATDYQTRTGKRVVVAYGASSQLAKQIEEGAPADLFISADRDWMDYLQAKSLIGADTRRDLLGNRIVLVAPTDEAKPVPLVAGALRAALG